MSARDCKTFKSLAKECDRSPLVISMLVTLKDIPTTRIGNAQLLDPEGQEAVRLALAELDEKTRSRRLTAAS